VAGTLFSKFSFWKSGLIEPAIMPTGPFVSVIVIFFNARPFFREAIDSIFAQTYPNWELILADDGSTDGSTEIAKEYERQYPGRVRYVEHEEHRNRGMSPTRNLAVRHGRGEWIAFLDADDVWVPNKLEHQMCLLAKHPDAGLLYGSPLYWFSWSEIPAGFNDCQPGLGVPPESLIYPPELLLRNYPLGKGPAPCPSDLVVARAVYERVGGFEESFGGSYQMYEDQAFLAKVYRTTPVFASGFCWTRYRQHPAACTIVNRDSGRYKHVRRFFLEYLERLLLEDREQNPAVWEALRRAWWPYEHPVLAEVESLFARGARRARKEISRARGTLLRPSVRGS
jgi:glycosyltransferase involved in cell wall biosynthesis